MGETYQERNMKHCDLGDLSVTKQNKLSCFKDKYNAPYIYVVVLSGGI
jgi:hypothetical protein